MKDPFLLQTYPFATYFLITLCFHAKNSAFYKKKSQYFYYRQLRCGIDPQMYCLVLKCIPLQQTCGLQDVYLQVLFQSYQVLLYFPQSVNKTCKDFKTGICCFSTKHAALRSKSKDWLAVNQDNVLEFSIMSTNKLFQ